MHITEIEPTEDGKQTELTVKMSTAEAKLFMQLLSEGKLDHLGVTGTSVTPRKTISPASNWTKTAGSRRTKSNRPDEREHS
jgi:hypothetical protein